MRNLLLALVVTVVLIVGAVAGTFAGFVDTEVSRDNTLQMGILDLLISGVPDNLLTQHNDDYQSVGPIISIDDYDPAKGSRDFYLDAYSRSTIDGFLYMHYKDINSTEAGEKDDTVYYRPGNYYCPPAWGCLPTDPNHATSEPEWIAEMGGQVGQFWIGAHDPNLDNDPDKPCWQENMEALQGLGDNYASGVAEHLSIATYKYVDADGMLCDPDVSPKDGKVSGSEKAALIEAGGEEILVTELSGTLQEIECRSVKLGTLEEQERTIIHIQVDVPQIMGPLIDYNGDGVVDDGNPNNGDEDLEDQLLRWWPTNAIQGDMASWDMLFMLTSDP
jgi:hypothetical protein